jgi:hypothetical protein
MSLLLKFLSELGGHEHCVESIVNGHRNRACDPMNSILQCTQDKKSAKVNKMSFEIMLGTSILTSFTQFTHHIH